MGEKQKRIWKTIKFMRPSLCRHLCYQFNWHSFVIKIQYVFFCVCCCCCTENFFFMVDSMSFWSEFSLDIILTLMNRLVTSKATEHSTPSLISAIFSFLLESCFGFLVIRGEEKNFLRQKTKLELEQKCVIYNYSFSNPVRLPVAELQLDSSSCKPIQSLRTLLHFSAFENLFSCLKKKNLWIKMIESHDWKHT